jgi:hypothetical protein
LLPGGAGETQISLFAPGTRAAGARRLAGKVADALTPSPAEPAAQPAEADDAPGQAVWAELADALAGAPLDRMSPREALEWLYRWQSRLRNRPGSGV